MEKGGKITLFVGFVLLAVAGVIGFYSSDLIQSVGAVTTDSTVSNATVVVSIGFTFSGNLSDGILFGNVNINSDDNNATGNYLFDLNSTSYNILMDSGNNVNTDTCIKDNAPLSSGGNTIPNTGYTFDANTTISGANMNNPAGSVAVTTSFVKFGTASLAASANQFIQYFLDVPNGQASGAYNNTIDFKIVETGQSC